MRKLAWFAGGFALLCLAGCCGSRWVFLSAAALSLLVGLVSLPLHLRFRRHFDPPRLWQIARRGLALALGGMLAAGWFAGWTALFRAPADALAGQTLTLTGVVTDYPRSTSIGGYSMTVELDGGITAPDVLVYASPHWGDLLPGDRITFTAPIKPADTLYGNSTTYYSSRGIFLLGYCDEAPLFHSRPHRTPVRFWPVVCARALKGSLSASFGPLAPLAIAVTTGDREGLSEEVTSALSRTGTAHTVAVSGMHLSFLMGVVLMLTRRKRALSLMFLPLLFFYVLTVGATPSAIRAAVMQSVLLFAPLFRRESDSPTSLSFALLLILLSSPYAAASVSLQLSFASVAGILLLAEPLARGLLRPFRSLRKRHNGFWWNQFFRLLTGGVTGISVGLGAMFFTQPLLCLYFGSFSLVFLLTNLLVLWAVSVFFVGALVVGVAGILLPAIGLLAPIPALFGRYILWVVTGVGRWPFAAVDTGNLYYLLCLAGIYLFVAAAFLFPREKIRLPIPLSCLALLFAAALLFSRQGVNGELTVTALNVGQGASTALLSAGQTCLVDCGGNGSDNAGDTAADYFAGMGIRQLDLLVFTHFDRDHFNGAAQLFARMDVSQVAVPDVDTAYGQMEELLALAEAEGATVTYVTREMTLPLGEAVLTLYPPLGSGTSNEEGLFALCTAGEFDALITGDADSFVEKMLIKYYNIPDTELLLVGHHGSGSSTCEELLDRIAPELAIISVGYNSYGHPHADVLSRLEERDIRVYRTDTDGTTTIRISDGQIVIK